MTIHIPPAPTAHTHGDTAGKEPPLIPMPRLVGHGCFGCGSANPAGLGMTFSRQGEQVISLVTLRREHMGWDRIAHGGVVSTLLDEVMAYAVIALERTFFVTRKMTVTYRRPVPLEAPLRAEGVITGRDAPRGCQTAGRILDAQGTLLASAEAEMVFLPEERLHMVSVPLREEMLQLFAAMAALDRVVAP